MLKIGRERDFSLQREKRDRQRIHCQREEGQRFQSSDSEREKRHRVGYSVKEREAEKKISVLVLETGRMNELFVELGRLPVSNR